LPRDKDVTDLFTVEATGGKVDFLDISDRSISQLIKTLEAYTKGKVQSNYNVTADSVTKKQIEEAQSLLNALLKVQKS